MEEITKLEFNNFYHIYNRGNNYNHVFFEHRNYIYFMNLLEKHVLPFINLYAFCLLPTHFHFLIKVKSEEDLGEYHEEILKYKDRSQEYVFFSRKFSSFFNAYAKSLN
jgi:hypothetical protein